MAGRCDQIEINASEMIAMVKSTGIACQCVSIPNYQAYCLCIHLRLVKCGEMRGNGRIPLLQLPRYPRNEPRLKSIAVVTQERTYMDMYLHMQVVPEDDCMQQCCPGERIRNSGGTGWWLQKRPFLSTPQVLRDINIGPHIIHLSNAPKALSNKTINTPKTPKDK